ncbi:MAG: ribosome-associated translation inhibitor RaiA [Bacteroidota bacterium]|jgi:putative sigma-54 modulation protein
MNTKITALHFKADQKLEEFIHEKLNKLDKLSNNIIGSDVILKIENTEKPNNKTVEIRLKIKGIDLHAEKTASSFESAFDHCNDAIHKQLTKSIEKTRV